MKSTTPKSRRPAKARKATTRTKSRVAKKRVATAAKKRSHVRKPAAAPRKPKKPNPPKNEEVSVTRLRDRPEEMNKQEERNRQQSAASEVTVDWGPTSHDHTPQELDLIVKKLQAGGPHDIKLAQFGTTMRFSTRPVPGSRPAGADISKRVGKTVFFTIQSGFW